MSYLPVVLALAVDIYRFRDRYIIMASDNNFQQFLVHFRDYMEAVCKEAELRERGELLTVADYLPLRRENSAIRLSFKLAEFSLGIDIPEEVFANDVFMSLYLGAADMVCWANVRMVHVFLESFSANQCAVFISPGCL